MASSPIATPKFASKSKSFHLELKKRINQYFQETGTPTSGNYKLYFKAGILLISFIASYIHLVFFMPPIWLAVIECIFMGGITAAIGFNIMHDGAHGSFSKSPFINELAARTLHFSGSDLFMWKTKHNVVHHAYTNIDGIDDDIDAKPFLRLCKTQKYYRIHKYQYLYFWMAYCMLYFYWVFYTDYQKYVTRKVGTMPLKKMEKKDHISFWGFKASYYIFFIILPIFTVGFVPWLVGYLIYGAFTGLVLATVFQMAHTVEGTHFPVPSSANMMEDEWAIHQLKTTANFATNNKLISWLTGGLNFQVEHHLFPKISHVHYPAINKIIRQACADYGIPYLEYPKLRLALASHVSHLKHLGER
jgi:linoleoyl-CoA desaturase